MAQLFYESLTLPSSPTPAFPIVVQVGFQPARIEIINFTQLKTPTTLHGYKAQWWFGMDSPGAMITEFDTNSAATTAGDRTTYITTGGITLLNSLGSEAGQYGAVISGFTNANPGVITVDSTYNANITAGDIVRVANVADDQSGPTLNGNYYVTSVTGTTITLAALPAGYNAQGYTVSSPNTTSSGVYISGGFVTVLTNSNPSVPNPPFNVYSNVPRNYNQAVQGFSFGQNSFPNGSAADTYLIQAWSNMVQI